MIQNNHDAFILPAETRFAAGWNVILRDGKVVIAFAAREGMNFEAAVVIEPWSAVWLGRAVLAAASEFANISRDWKTVIEPEVAA